MAAGPTLPLPMPTWRAQHGILRSFGLNGESDDLKKNEKRKAFHLILVNVEKRGKKRCGAELVSHMLESLSPRVT